VRQREHRRNSDAGASDAPARITRRQLAGIGALVVSAGGSLLDLSHALHPLALRWRAHGGAERTIAVVFGSLTFQAVILCAAAALTFWPVRRRRHSRDT
jgi:hypothetical protein